MSTRYAGVFGSLSAIKRMEHYIYQVEEQGRVSHYLSILPNEFVFSNGLTSQAFVGKFQSSSLLWSEFAENKQFKDLFHKIIAETLPNDEPFIEAGRRSQTRYVYLLDQRTKDPEGNVPARDIIGAMEFENGRPLLGSYSANPNYKLLTEDGIFQVPSYILDRLIKELKGYK